MIPEFDWLPVACSCQKAFVKVTQYEVRWLGVTRSCGRADCAGEPGDFLGTPGQSVKGGGFGAAWTGVRPSNRYLGRSEPDEQQPRLPPRITTTQIRKLTIRVLPPMGLGRRGKPTIAEQFVVALRRDQVLERWREGWSMKRIADNLNLASYLVANDLTYLRKKGRLVESTGWMSRSRGKWPGA
jgi:hypothetical protein